MRTHVAIIAGIILLLTLVWMPPERSHAASAGQCVDALNKEIASEHRAFRAVLFGQSKAANAPVGTVVYEKDGSSWYKISSTEWQSTDTGYENTTHYNATIDQQSEMNLYFGKPDRKGIFETKRVSTSELIPYIGSSLRSFQCRLYQFCDAVEASKRQEGEDAVTVTSVFPGCAENARPSIPACHLNSVDTLSNNALIYQNCRQAIDTLLEQEATMVDLTVQYDAAYRTLAQLAGSMDLFLQELHVPMTDTIQQAVDLIGAFNRIPCFLASCDASPPPQQ